ncbi:hypothetical protein BS78_05G245200 [Paspalum vaginatum]|nr:hypothetical protein BS78_05G245200 [Paspalum vaginatum]
MAASFLVLDFLPSFLPTLHSAKRASAASVGGASRLRGRTTARRRSANMSVLLMMFPPNMPLQRCAAAL